jgi:hypothetical protein
MVSFTYAHGSFLVSAEVQISSGRPTREGGDDEGSFILRIRAAG